MFCDAVLLFCSPLFASRHLTSRHTHHDSHPDPSQAAMIMSGGEDGSARMMHVQNKRVVGTLVHCDAGAVRCLFLAREIEGGGVFTYLWKLLMLDGRHRQDEDPLTPVAYCKCLGRSGGCRTRRTSWSRGFQVACLSPTCVKFICRLTPLNISPGCVRRTL